MVAETSNKPVSFFPEALSAQNKKSAPSQPSEFESVLSEAQEPNSAPDKKERKVTTISDLKRLDKPKVMNREPFFPKTPMPYHPEEREVIIYNPFVNPGEHAMESSEASPEMDMLMMNGEPLGYDLEDDDLQGIIAQSYESSSAVYPVGQIAPEAVPESVKENLNSQGLWTAKPFVVAQPTERLNLMNQMVGNQETEPVSRPVAQFMASMESELGVNSEDIVKAFEKLHPGELQKTPADTLVQVIKNLDLNPEDQAKAAELSLKLVYDLKDQANDSMLMTQQKVDKSAVNPELAAGMYARESQFDGAKPVPMPAQGDVVVPNETKSNSFQSQSYSQNQNQNQFQSQGQNLTQGFEKLESKKVSIPKDGSIKSEILESLKDIKAIPDSVQAGMQVGTPAGLAGLDGSGKADQAFNPVDNAARAEALREIANQAQILSTKGGGEVKMTLKPDHLGEIQLKVVMENGRVDVQMVADRHETKKLLEQNVHELKQSLASHNISVDRLDVGVQDKGLQGFQNQRFEQGGSSRDFAQYYQEQNHSGRRNESQSRQPRDSGSYEKRTLSSISSPMRASSRGSGRLNVVA